MLKFSVPVSAETKAIFPQAKLDRFMVGTLPEFVKMLGEMHIGQIEDVYMIPNAFNGDCGFIQAAEFAQHGDMSSVAASDALLDKMDMIPAPTARHEIIDDVVGAFPNVPAFLAGQPLSMRRKVKRENEFQPLAIVVNHTSSGGVSAEQLKIRGTAILALVRAISARRPVELWAGKTSCAANATESGSLYFRVDTQPLDLARAGFLLCHPAVNRALMLPAFIAHLGVPYGSKFPWQYNGAGNLNGLRKTFPQIIARGFPHYSDVLAVHACHLNDPIINDPIQWIKDNVAQYTGEGEAKEAA